MKLSPCSNKNGFTLVEVVIVTAIIGSFLVALLGAYSLYLKIAFSNLRKTQAIFLAEEGLEAMKLMRDTSWGSKIAAFPIGNTYGLTFTGTGWATTSSTTLYATFERVVTLEDVYRDGQSDIIASGGTLDLDTKKVVVSVSWKDGTSTTTKTMATYITNLFDN